MLNISRSSRLREIVVSTYCSEVACRLSIPRWSFPTAWKRDVDSVVSAIEKSGVRDPVLFVKSQFSAMNKSFCIRVFYRPYPVFNVLGTHAAVKRYHEHGNRHIRNDVPDDTVIERRIIKDISSGLDTNNIVFMILSGAVSVHTLVFARAINRISAAEYDKVLADLSDVNSDYAVECDRSKAVVKSIAERWARDNKEKGCFR